MKGKRIVLMIVIATQSELRGASWSKGEALWKNGCSQVARKENEEEKKVEDGDQIEIKLLSESEPRS